MRGLTPQNLLEVCEWAENEHPANRALALLYAACPEASWEELASLSIGQRDVRLLELRERTFGNKMQGFSDCEHCGEQLEFVVTTSALKDCGEDGVNEPILDYHGESIRFRVPNSVDLIAVSHINDPAMASSALVQRCLLDVNGESPSYSNEALTDELVGAIAEQMSLCDPQAEILVNLNCPACKKDSQSLLDIGSYIWIEFFDLAKCLMQQVYWLARGYGWCEEDILKMSAWRRRYYQELLNV